MSAVVAATFRACAPGRLLNLPRGRAARHSHSLASTWWMQPQTDDTRIMGYDALVEPSELFAQFPVTAAGRRTVLGAREDAARVLRGEDDRLIVIVGPCSIHDVEAAKVYGRLLQPMAERHSDDLVVIMRAYFEKPRTTVGWKGLINDPDIDGSFRINHGLRLARGLLVELTDSGMPVACELLDTISPQFLGDLVSWGAIGARTTESQLHRELASGVSFPVGFKNGTDGSTSIAVDAIISAAQPHHFLGVSKCGRAAITRTRGNDLCHVILRGSKSGPNYARPFVEDVKRALFDASLPQRVMIDCSHGNCGKLHTNQPAVAANVAAQIAAGDDAIMGVMIESNIHEGAQRVPREGGRAGLRFGVSITDPCVDIHTTERMLSDLAAAVRARRQHKRL